MELIGTNVQIDFLGKKNFAFILSFILMAASIYIWIVKGDEKYGIDFRGGYEFVIQVPAQASTTQISDALDTVGLTGTTVQKFEALGLTNQYSIRIGLRNDLDSKGVRERVEQALKPPFGDTVSIIKSDSVGATIGEEIKRSALLAVTLGLISILIYIGYRFEFSFALGAVVALFHDVIAATGAYLYAGHDLNSFALAAALTIVGYSVNDTIVIFDRVREEMLKRPATPLAQLINESLNFCLSRTIITSLLTFLSVLALLIFGGGAIQDLSVYLVAGLISGTYSTIYIASPVVLWWEAWRGRRSSVAKKRAQGAPA